jgi:hypothetical protein
MIFDVYNILVVAHVIVQGTGSIQYTEAVALHVLPAPSLKVNVNDPFPVNVYVLDPELSVIVIGSEYHVSDTITLPVVADPDHGLY